MNWRDIKRQARQTVHATMAIPCWRVSSSGEAIPTRARLHLARTNQTNAYTGDLESLGYAETASIAPRLIFDRTEYQPKQGDSFIFAPGEGYAVDAIRPFDDTMSAADCNRMSPQQIADLPALTWPVPEPV